VNHHGLVERIAAELMVTPVGPDEKYFNEDLHALSDGALRLERSRLRTAVLFAERPSEWALERLQRIEVEMSARHGR
jgi:hypothetical protein